MHDAEAMRGKLTAQLRGWGKEVLHRVRKRVSFYDLENRTPTFVYQMGKVGSSTLARTLERMHSPPPVVHVHTLNPTKVGENIETLRADPGYLQEHVVTSLTLVRKQLEWGGFSCNVITLTREPVGRAISFAFQDWKRQLPDVPDLAELNAGRMIDLVMEKLKPGSVHANPGQWFERELESVFGIDVMSIPYDFEQGYVKICRGPVDVLVLRMEDLNRSMESGLADLYEVEERTIQMVPSNLGKKKEYAELLAEVKESLTLPSAMSERIWGTDYAEHFYGPDIDQLREKWERTK